MGYEYKRGTLSVRGEGEGTAEWKELKYVAYISVHIYISIFSVMKSTKLLRKGREGIKGI
jgi:hypothetical protein